MPATSKTELRAIAEKEFAKLQKLIAPIEESVAMLPDPEADGTTIKDTIAHRAHWITLFLGWYETGQSGQKAEIPAPDYKWSELKRYNADLRASQHDLSWEGAKASLDANHQTLLAMIDTLDDGALYGGPMQGGNNKWTTGRWAEAAGPSHYRSAAKYIRAQLRALAATA